ncbi:MAG: DUF1569 domain-containing protein [Trueperaceae bacterium]|nr:DUF1569 domain-containing protein [Trueperaceae bacterium]
MYEPHQLQAQFHQEMLGRLEKLSPSSQAQWGKMDVAQMLAHLATALEETMTTNKVRQTLLGRIFGKVAKRQVLNKGLAKNMPTLPSIKIADPKEFQQEKKRFVQELERFLKGGEAGIRRPSHDFFGRMTPNEWARLQYLHIDHHFRQFRI